MLVSHIDWLLVLSLHVVYFDILNLAWKFWTPNPPKKTGHWPPKF